MRLVKIAAACMIFAFITGCVGSGAYKAKVAENENLKKNYLALEEKLKTREAEKAKLEADLAKLKSDFDALSKEKESLAKDNTDLKRLLEAKKDELTNEITSLKAKMKEMESEIRNKNAQIIELKNEIAGLSKEKSQAMEEKEKAIAQLKTTYDSLVQDLNEEIKKGEIAVTQLRDKLSLSMVEKILFDSGSADIKKEGKKILDKVVPIMKKVTDKQIRIEGHTDNIPIGPRIAKKFPSNWELSTTRATNVVRYLQEKGIDPKFLNAAGYAQYLPLGTNETEEGRSKNRRIEIYLIPLDFDRIAAEPKK